MCKGLKIFFVAMLFVFSGCNDSGEPDNPSAGGEYYVKYEAYVKSIYVGYTVKYTVDTDKGRQVFEASNSFSQTFGPLKKGFKTSITADASSCYRADCDVRIYVCRGQEPFALKASNSGDKIVSATYVIDF